jgi:hypothetical protein
MYKRFAVETALIFKLLLPQGFINRDFSPCLSSPIQGFLGLLIPKKSQKGVLIHVIMIIISVINFGYWNSDIRMKKK